MCNKWTVLKVADHFDEAVRTLKRLPKVKMTGYFNSWPDHTRTVAEQLQAAKTPLKLPPPTPEAITRMQECLEWICWLDEEDERLLVWMRSSGVSWKLICRRVGYGRTKAWQKYCVALLKIVTRLNVRQMAGLDVKSTRH